MKLIIAGGRDFVPEAKHWAWLDGLHGNTLVCQVVCGMAKGADLFGSEWAKARGIPIAEFAPDWKLHGRGAGPVRNGQMAENADAVVLFPGGKGTENMRNQAVKHGLTIYDWREKE